MKGIAWPSAVLLFLCLVFQSCGLSAGTGAELTPTLFSDHLTQYGITWSFDKPHETGQFANGDWFVVGPVTVVDINPESVIRPEDGRVMNGSMLNPKIERKQGYDSMMMGINFNNVNGSCWYDSALNAARPGNAGLSASNPLSITTGSLVSCISYPELPTAGNWSDNGRRVRIMAVLTIVDAVPVVDSFRPPYVGTDKTVRHVWADARSKFDALPKLSLPGTTLPVMSDLLPLFEKPWIEHIPSWVKQAYCAPDNMPNYGREYAAYMSDAACMMLMDTISAEDRALLAKRIVQIGLDNYGMVIAQGGGDNWAADGGHMSGRVFPILLAGYLLGDALISGVMKKSGDYAYASGFGPGNPPSDYIHFAEMDQTFIVRQGDVDYTHSSLWNPDKGLQNTDTTLNAHPYMAADIGKARWGIRHVSEPQRDDNSWDAWYLELNARAWVGFAVASRILGLEATYNHPAFFGFMDEWMGSPRMPRNIYDSKAWNAFQQAMWDAYWE